MTTMSSAASLAMGRDDDREYADYLGRVQARFAANVGDGPLFTTDANDDAARTLFHVYLDNLADRQHHNCHACRQFLETHGGLATIDEEGRTAPAIWAAEDAPEYYRPAIEAVSRAVRKAQVTGVFLSADARWGTPVTPCGKTSMTWHHYSVTPPTAMVYRGKLLTAGQAMAEKREDFKNVIRALFEYQPGMLDQACRLLEGESLYRSEKVAGPARWLRDLSAKWTAARGPSRDNLVWRAIATAPAGFCHPRSSMVGTLLDDIAGGMTFAEASRRFAAKMHPLSYQRPQAAPSAGAIVAAEKLVETLGIARSLERRYARLEEIEAIWRPPVLVGGPRPTGGVFGHLTPRDATPAPAMTLPPVTMTWEKFARVVLPTAESIEYYVKPGPAGFTGLLTAEHADAPPILQWDAEGRRNPVSTYVYSRGSTPGRWGLTGGKYHKVNAVALMPWMWGPDPGRFSHQATGVLFVLDGAKDTSIDGNALFPEILKSELHGVRSVIEAYSGKARPGGAEEGSANGIGLTRGGRWDETFRVTSCGASQVYKLDRWD